MTSVELLEIRDFLAEYPPFSILDGEALAELVRDMTVCYVRRGSPFPPQDEPSPHCYVVRKGAIEQRDDEALLQAKFAEGDLFDAGCVGTPMGDCVAVEDCLLYCLPCTRLQDLRRSNADVDLYFERSLGERLRHARKGVGDRVLFRPNLMSMSVGAFLTRAPVLAPSSCSIRGAAQLMGEQAVSALLVVDDEDLAGIVTDRDLRARCLATGLSPEKPLSEIMTADPKTIDDQHTAFEALMLMTRHAIDHLPVVDSEGLRGLVTTRDLLRVQSANAAHLAMLVRSADNAAALPALSAELPELQMHMLSGGATSGQIGQAVSSIADALASRLLELGEAQLGPAPVPYAWLAGGSQGRQEQTTHSDQDNALVLHDDFDPATHGEYFEALARFVTDGLDTCGFRYCPGDIMASNPKWRQPLQHWLANYRQWMRHTDAPSARLLINFLDLRLVAGDAGLHEKLCEAISAESVHDERYLAQLVENTLENRPPLGFFRSFVVIDSGEHANKLDIKTKGIIPIVDLARIQALAVGVTEVNTVRRLRACAARKVLSAEAASELEEAYEFLGLLRVRHQVEQIRAGHGADNFIDPDGLTSLERRHLKDVFAVIASMQRTLAMRYAITAQG